MQSKHRLIGSVPATSLSLDRVGSILVVYGPNISVCCKSTRDSFYRAHIRALVFLCNLFCVCGKGLVSFKTVLGSNPRRLRLIATNDHAARNIGLALAESSVVVFGRRRLGQHCDVTMALVDIDLSKESSSHCRFSASGPRTTVHSPWINGTLHSRSLPIFIIV